MFTFPVGFFGQSQLSDLVPPWGQVSLLLEGDGTHGSTTITDSSSFNHVLTRQGSIQISTSQGRFGGSSIYSNGTAGNRIDCPLSSAFSLASRVPFTVESFLYVDTPTTRGGVFSFRSSTSYCEFVVQCENNGSFRILIGSSPSTWQTVAETTTSVYPFNAWFHLAFSGDGSLIRLFCNGVKRGEWNHPNWSGWSAPRPFYVLEDADGTFRGWMDEARFVKGTCLYTTNFTPPTAPFPIG